MPINPRTPKVYLVTTEGKGRLVRAFSQIGAIKHAVHTVYEAHVATQNELINALARGAKVEEAGESLGEQEELDV